MRLADFTPPDTLAAHAALEFATVSQSESMLNHCVRSWLWAAGFAAVESRGYDAELLYVAALLHDIGLVEAFDNHTLAFEDASGHAADALTAGAGWPAERRIRVREVIQRHNWPSVDPAMDVEGYLLEIATALDISGARADVLPLDFQKEVLAAYPRLDLAAEFGASVADQAERKPASAAARLIGGGMHRKLAENPLEQRGR
ncbi:HD domain-containing protein [Leifsonia sp. NPDC058230]|uniref:HD domain-containing protein n=1 Tax=Leifsonia sp. NPDC058230 TaxID=3346391 RepID=UPI0036DA01C2